MSGSVIERKLREECLPLSFAGEIDVVFGFCEWEMVAERAEPVSLWLMAAAVPAATDAYDDRRGIKPKFVFE